MQQICANGWCGKEFVITDEELAFYDKVSPVFNGVKYPITPPTLCPSDRSRRRLVWRNSRFLYNRICDATGKNILSIYHPGVPFPVYDNGYWWSDRWDALGYGQDIDFTKPFFEQYAQLMHRVPHINLQNAGNENADYTSYAGWNKNCYWIFFADHNRDCCYLEDSFHCVDCLDCSYAHRCTLCYECFFCADCYACRFSVDSNNCSDSWFLKSCIGCKDCFGCVNLRNKQYHFFNEACTREEYERKLGDLDLRTLEGIAAQLERFQAHVLRHPHKYREGVNNEHVTGNYVNFSKNVRNGFIVEYCQDCMYISDSQRCVDCVDMDGWGGSGAQLVYEGQTVGEGVHYVLFSNYIDTGSSDVLYSDWCNNGCRHVFGCYGLRGKQYCIFNKQYDKSEYERLASKLIEHMQRTGEWGEFFPISLSPYGYNETMAHQVYPLTKEEATANGFAWKEEEHRSYEGTYADFSQLPRTIDHVDDGVCNNVFTCKTSGKPYKIQRMEWAFYRKMGLPIPHKHPDTRFQRRLRLRNPRTLWNRACAKCQQSIETTYQPSRPEIVYCEQCYLETVY